MNRPIINQASSKLTLKLSQTNMQKNYQFCIHNKIVGKFKTMPVNHVKAKPLKYQIVCKLQEGTSTEIICKCNQLGAKSTRTPNNRLINKLLEDSCSKLIILNEASY